MPACVIFRVANHHTSESGAKGNEEIWGIDADGGNYQEVHFGNLLDWGWSLWHWKEAAT